MVFFRRNLPGIMSALLLAAMALSGPAAAQVPASPAPALTMFPHPEGARLFIAGQANIISQANPPFHSPYAGPNSFRSVADDETSVVETLYLAARPTRSVRYSTDLILNV